MTPNDLLTFVRVAETGSLAAAARDLKLPRSTVSRRIARLEDRLGVPLLSRSGRRVVLTDIGQRLHKRAAGPLRDLRDAERELVDAFDEPSGTLQIAAPHGIGETHWFSHLLTSYRQQHPGVVVNIKLTNRAVDLIGEGIDVALRLGVEEGQDLLTRRLGEISAGVYASREYVAQHGSPADASALGDHICVSHTASAGGRVPNAPAAGRGAPPRAAPRGRNHE